MGIGAPEHHPGPVGLQTWARQRPSGRRLVAPPGLWHLERKLPAKAAVKGLPNCWGDSHSAAAWLTTPTLAMVFEVEETLCAVKEAWLWPDHSR